MRRENLLRVEAEEYKTRRMTDEEERLEEEYQREARTLEDFSSIQGLRNSHFMSCSSILDTLN